MLAVGVIVGVCVTVGVRLIVGVRLGRGVSLAVGEEVGSTLGVALAAAVWVGRAVAVAAGVPLEQPASSSDSRGIAKRRMEYLKVIIGFIPNSVDFLVEWMLQQEAHAHIPLPAHATW